MHVLLKMWIKSLQVLRSITQNSLLNLRVSGYKGADLIFTNTTTLSFRNVSTFIQTDRSRYRPGDTVKIRVVSVQFHNHPYKGRVDVSIQVGLNNGRSSWTDLWLGIVWWWWESWTDVLLSHSGSQWERCGQLGVHREPGDRVAGIHFIPGASSWAVGSHSHSECKADTYLCPYHIIACCCKTLLFELNKKSIFQ